MVLVEDLGRGFAESQFPTSGSSLYNPKTVMGLRRLDSNFKVSHMQADRPDSNFRVPLPTPDNLRSKFLHSTQRLVNDSKYYD